MIKSTKDYLHSLSPTELIDFLSEIPEIKTYCQKKQSKLYYNLIIKKMPDQIYSGYYLEERFRGPGEIQFVEWCKLNLTQEELNVVKQETRPDLWL